MSRSLAGGRCGPATPRTPTVTTDLAIDRDACTAGWAEVYLGRSCNYTGGHYCTRPVGHAGMHICACGARAGHTVPPEGDQ